MLVGIRGRGGRLLFIWSRGEYDERRVRSYWRDEGDERDGKVHNAGGKATKRVRIRDYP